MRTATERMCLGCFQGGPPSRIRLLLSYGSGQWICKCFATITMRVTFTVLLCVATVDEDESIYKYTK